MTARQVGNWRMKRFSVTTSWWRVKQILTQFSNTLHSFAPLMYPEELYPPRYKLGLHLVVNGNGYLMILFIKGKLAQSGK